MSERTDYRVCLSPKTLHAELVEAERLRDYYRHQARKLAQAMVGQWVVAVAALVALLWVSGGAA